MQLRLFPFCDTYPEIQIASQIQLNRSTLLICLMLCIGYFLDTGTQMSFVCVDLEGGGIGWRCSQPGQSLHLSRSRRNLTKLAQLNLLLDHMQRAVQNGVDDAGHRVQATDDCTHIRREMAQ